MVVPNFEVLSSPSGIHTPELKCPYMWRERCLKMGFTMAIMLSR